MFKNIEFNNGEYIIDSGWYTGVELFIIFVIKKYDWENPIIKEFQEYVTKEAMNSLIKKFGLPKPDPFSQDWELEVSKVECLSQYIE